MLSVNKRTELEYQKCSTVLLTSLIFTRKSRNLFLSMQVLNKRFGRNVSKSLRHSLTYSQTKTCLSIVSGVEKQCVVSHSVVTWVLAGNRCERRDASAGGGGGRLGAKMLLLRNVADR